jgi:hypothetical protein
MTKHRGVSRRHVDAMRREAGGADGGAYRITIVPPADLHAIMTTLQDEWRFALRVAVLNMLKGPAPRSCLLCDCEISRASRPAALAVLTAYRDDPQRGAVQGICPRCWAEGDVLTRVVTVYAGRGFRLLPPLAAAGRV